MSDKSVKGMLNSILQTLGQVSVKVQDITNQFNASHYEQLLQILLQIFGQVLTKSTISDRVSAFKQRTNTF